MGKYHTTSTSHNFNLTGKYHTSASWVNILSGCALFTTHKQSLQRLCFHRCLSVHRGVSASGPEADTPQTDTPDRHPLGRYPPGQTPPRQIPPGQTPPGRHPSLEQHPFHGQTPHQTVPHQTPPWANTPCPVYAEIHTPPLPSACWDMHSTGMHSCYFFNHVFICSGFLLSRLPGGDGNHSHMR